MACPICSNAHATESATTSDARIIDCAQCGNFTISGRAIAVLNIPENFATERWKISAWINEFKPTRISPADLETAHKSAVPSLHHRAERMLRCLAEKFPPGKNFDIKALQDKQPQAYFGRTELMSTSASKLIPIGWNKDIIELSYMLNEVLCKELKWLVQEPSNTALFQISPKGLLYLEGRRESVSSVGFCAMWFSDEVLPLWTVVIAPAITAAGYEALRIDSKQHNGKIDDEIMASIRASKFVVSDFTGSRGGVYYEAGFAHGLGLPVIFMCRENDLKDIHFDVRQYNCILWTDDKLEEAQSQLTNRILATLGQGPKLVQ
jgi:nucleoside 2-deoxyribosyltransferase